jgi:hypothetical protein
MARHTLAAGGRRAVRDFQFGFGAFISPRGNPLFHFIPAGTGVSIGGGEGDRGSDLERWRHRTHNIVPVIQPESVETNGMTRPAMAASGAAVRRLKGSPARAHKRRCSAMTISGPMPLEVAAYSVRSAILDRGQTQSVDRALTNRDAGQGAARSGRRKCVLPPPAEKTARRAGAGAG